LPFANLIVLASKGGVECRGGAIVTVGVADLQEMQNFMREAIDQGLADLMVKQGQGTLPATVMAAKVAPVAMPFAQDAPPTEQNVVAVISQAAQDANRAEQEAITQLPANADAAPAPKGSDTHPAVPANRAGS
jgi:hypothetical protein